MPLKRPSEHSVSDAEMGRHRALLREPGVRSWYDARSLRSRLSADSYVRKLGFLLERLQLDPTVVVQVARDNPDRLRDLLVRYAALQKRAGRLDTYILKSFDGLRSYLDHSRVKFTDFPRLSPIRGASLRAERVPTPDELAAVLERLSVRGRVITLLMAHAGLRPGAIGSYGGEQGLRLSNLVDLRLGKKLEFTEIPFEIRVPGEISKTRVEYLTFGTRQTATVLVAYLEQRRAAGERLGPESPVVAAAATRGIAKQSRDHALFGRGFLSTKQVVEELRGALHATAPKGVTWRPYVCRSYCATRLLLAEGSQKISRDLREAILGHDGGVASRYHVAKKWGEELLAEARREYGNAAEFLETHPRSKGDEKAEILGILTKAIETATGKKADGHLRGEDLMRALRDALGHVAGPGGSSEPTTGGVPADPPEVRPAARPGEQRVVDAEDVGRHLEAGWTFRSPLNGHLAIVEWSGAESPHPKV